MWLDSVERPSGWRAETWRKGGKGSAKRRAWRRRVWKAGARRWWQEGPARAELARSSGSRMQEDTRAHAGEHPQREGIELEDHVVDHRPCGAERLADHLGDAAAEKMPSHPVESHIGAL